MRIVEELMEIWPNEVCDSLLIGLLGLSLWLSIGGMWAGCVLQSGYPVVCG